MGALEPDTPPAGEEIHLPGASLLPIAMAIGLSFVLLGLTITLPLTYVGAAIFLISLAMWVRDARREMSELPAEH